MPPGYLFTFGGETELAPDVAIARLFTFLGQRFALQIAFAFGDFRMYREKRYDVFIQYLA
jgi:hypothetical protein